MDKRRHKRKAWHPFQAQLEQTQAAIISTDRGGYITHWSRGAERLCEYSAEEAIGKHVAFLCLQEVPSAPKHSLLRSLYKKGYHECVFQMRRNSGKNFYAHWTLSFIREDTGSIVGIMAYLIDVTAYRKAITETPRYQDSLLAPLAQDLRGLLVPIRNAVQLLKIQATPEYPYLQQSQILIERQVDCLIDLADNLEEMARISCGQITLQKKRVDLVECIVQAAETMRPLLNAQGCHLALRLTPMPLLVEGDPQRLVQIIENLLHNTAKHMEKGNQIILSLNQVGSEAVLKIQNNGMGTPAISSGGFNPLATPQSPVGQLQSGLNLRLKVAKSLTELHGGRMLTYNLNPGHSGAVVICLPLAEVKSASTPPLPEETVFPASNRRRVLIVDDDQNITHSFAILLNLWGYEVKTAPDGLAALTLARTFQPEVILLDISLPDIDGREVARRLRAEYGQNLKLIALTGRSQIQNSQHDKETSFNQYLLKPPPMDVLKELLASLIPPPPQSSSGSHEQNSH